MRSWRAVLVLLLLGVVLWGTTEATLEALRPAVTAARSAPTAPTAPVSRLTPHVLFVVVDGLRWDIANDPRIMPRFAQAMTCHTSAEIWASPISMTSSAVLAFGTGQRGSLNQVLENLRLPEIQANSWLENAHRTGLRLMAAGDAAWSQLYGKYLTEFRPDPVGVAIEASFDARTFRNARELQEKSPDFLVAHFVTPDHQGHAHGIRSDHYTEYMRLFDYDLFAWLDAVPNDWTVIVTSDHGAAESGTHGTDTSVQRRCPIFAYGPGIRAGVHLPRALDQVELPGQFAALLGVNNAQQSRGVTPLDWIDGLQAIKQRLACADISRVAELEMGNTEPSSTPSLASAIACCNVGGGSKNCVSEARQVVAAYDAGLVHMHGIQSRRAWPWIAAVIAASVGAAVLLLGRRVLLVAALGSFWLCISLALTVYVERLPGVTPNLLRAVLFALTNGLLLLGALRINRWAVALERHAALTLSIFPGWLLVSYTTNTQVEAYFAVVVVGLLLCSPAVRARFWRGQPMLRSDRPLLATAAVLIAALASLSMAGTRPSDIRPELFVRSAPVGAILAGLVLLTGLLCVPQARRMITNETQVGAPPLLDQNRALRSSKCGQCWTKLAKIAMVLGCFALAHIPIHSTGRALWLTSVLALLVSVLYRRSDWAFLFGIASYTWVARDYEWLVFAPALVIAEVVGEVSSRHKQLGKLAPTTWLALHVTFLFALTNLLRIGLQGGIQLETLDLTVGTYGDGALPLWFSAACLGYKFVIAQVLVLGLYLRHFQLEVRASLLVGLCLAYLARSVSLLLMLFLCGQSYWTAFRVVADLPFGFLQILGVLIVGLAAPLWATRKTTETVTA